MAARSAISYVVKWLIIPGAIGALGYYLVGPRIGTAPPIKIKGLTDTGSTKPPQTTVENTDAPDHHYPQPDVQVQTVNGHGRRVEVVHKPRHKTPRKKKPVDTPTTTPVDQGGSGGAAAPPTTGGTTGDGGRVGN